MGKKKRAVHTDFTQYGKLKPFSIWSIKGNVVMKHNHWYLFEPLIGGYYQAILTGQAFTKLDEARKALKYYPKDEHKKIVARLWYDGAYMPNSEVVIWTAEKGFNVHDEVIQPRNVPSTEPNVPPIPTPIFEDDKYYIFTNGNQKQLVTFKSFDGLDDAKDYIIYNLTGTFDIQQSTKRDGWVYHCSVATPRLNISDMVDPLRKPTETALIDIRAKVDEARALLKQVDDIREELFRSHKVTSTITENTVGYVTFGVAPFMRHTLNSKVEL